MATTRAEVVSSSPAGGADGAAAKSSSRMAASDDVIADVTLLREANWLERWDVAPFAVLYGLSFAMILRPQEVFELFFQESSDSSDFIPSVELGIAAKSEFQWVQNLGLVICPLVLLVHLCLFLAAQASVAIRAKIGKRTVDSIEKASVVFVHAHRNAGVSKLVPLERRIPLSIWLAQQQQMMGVPQEIITATSSKQPKLSVFGEDFHPSDAVFTYQELTYEYDLTKNSFHRVTFPSLSTVAPVFNWTGYQNPSNFLLAIRRWGLNEFQIPVPAFLDLFVEHLIAPFFVFQLVCLFLWSLDDYWYYSMFTLLMLLVFESIMCHQRRMNLLSMRAMRRRSFPVLVWRYGNWLVADSQSIVPGDIISLAADTKLERQMRKQRGEDVSEEDEERIVPCDVLLLRGKCVLNEAMLTGESVPKVKEAVTKEDQIDELQAQLAAVRMSSGGDSNSSLESLSRHMLMGGTVLQQHTHGNTTDDNNVLPTTPDGGVLCVVLRTGFGTTQGELMRKILFATEGVSQTSKETFQFIGVLVLFALLAAVHVLFEGLRDERRNRFRLALHCIMVITSVVPPELPMELSLAVTNSLTALSKSLVFCTEPFRIAWAGRLTYVCFDKTGTLTKDEMILKGIVGTQELSNLVSSNNELTNELEGLEGSDSAKNDSNYEISDTQIAVGEATNLIRTIMGCCHDLAARDPRSGVKGASVIGDPLEVAAFEPSTFVFQPTDSKTASEETILRSDELAIEACVGHKYPFSSELKRMSAIVSLRRLALDESSVQIPAIPAGGFLTSSMSIPITPRFVATGEASHYVFTKGAPEVIQPFLKSLPSNYSAIYQRHMQAGKRVLVLAYKPLPSTSNLHEKLVRSDAEKDLHFAGFLLFDSNLKPDSKSVIRELRSSRHRVQMITGDSVYTAVSVSKRLAIIDSTLPALVLVPLSTSTSEKFEAVWRRIEDLDEANTVLRCDADEPFNVLSLPALTREYSLSITGPALDNFISFYGTTATELLSRIAPHISIFARVSPAQKECVIQSLNAAGEFTLMCGDGTNDVGALKAAHVGLSIVNNPKLESRVDSAADSLGAKRKGKLSSKDRMARAMLELQENDKDPSLVKLGDASIASSFTAKRTSIDSVLSVIRQGRCTLVTSIQVYKVLALNCLASAYMMSTLYLRGLKHGDTQMTISGIVVTIMFFFLSQAKPLPAISHERPPHSVFCAAVSWSIIGQFAVHLACMYATMRLCESHPVMMAGKRISPDGRFAPNLLNSCMFILSNQMQVNNFWVNYRGPPFMESLGGNPWFLRLLQGVYLVILIVVGGQFEPINDLLQLVQLPDANFQVSFLAILLANAGITFAIERYCRKLE